MCLYKTLHILTYVCVKYTYICVFVYIHVYIHLYTYIKNDVLLPTLP